MKNCDIFILGIGVITTILNIYYYTKNNYINNLSIDIQDFQVPTNLNYYRYQ